MTRKIFLAALFFIIASEAAAIDLKAPLRSGRDARTIIKPPALPVSQSLKLQELLTLSPDRFKQRLPEVLQLLQDYEFTKRSMREREVQIREYLRLAVKAIEADDTAEADDYVYNAYSEFRADFDTVIRDISIGRFKNEVLTAAEMTKLKCNLELMQQARRDGNDPRKTPICTAN